MLRRGLKVGHLNVNRLYSKLDSIKERLNLSKLDVLGLSETWLTSDILDGELRIEIFNNSLNRINSTGDVCVLGDFYIDFDSTRDRSTKQKFKSCLLSNDLVQIVKKPRRFTESSKTLIDLI